MGYPSCVSFCGVCDLAQLVAQAVSLGLALPPPCGCFTFSRATHHGRIVRKPSVGKVVHGGVTLGRDPIYISAGLRSARPAGRLRTARTTTRELNKQSRRTKRATCNEAALPPPPPLPCPPADRGTLLRQEEAKGRPGGRRRFRPSRRRVREDWRRRRQRRARRERHGQEGTKGPQQGGR